MVLAAWFTSGATLLSRHEYTLSQVGTHPDMSLDVARMYNNNKAAPWGNQVASMMG